MNKPELHFCAHGKTTYPVGKGCRVPKNPDNATCCLMTWMRTTRRRCARCVKGVQALEQEQAGA